MDCDCLAFDFLTTATIGYITRTSLEIGIDGLRYGVGFETGLGKTDKVAA